MNWFETQSAIDELSDYQTKTAQLDCIFDPKPMFMSPAIPQMWDAFKSGISPTEISKTFSKPLKFVATQLTKLKKLEEEFMKKCKNKFKTRKPEDPNRYDFEDTWDQMEKLHGPAPAFGPIGRGTGTTYRQRAKRYN